MITGNNNNACTPTTESIVLNLAPMSCNDTGEFISTLEPISKAVSFIESVIIILDLGSIVILIVITIVISIVISVFILIVVLIVIPL